MTSTLIGFVLLFSPCGKDACEWVPVTEKIYPTVQACQRVIDGRTESATAALRI